MNLTKNEYRYLHYWVEKQLGKPSIKLGASYDFQRKN